MRIETPAEQLLYTTVLLETENSSTGEKSLGTSFVFSYEVEGNTYLFLVTNKHVVGDSKNGKFFFTKKAGEGPAIGQRFDIHIGGFSSAWFGHPDPSIDVTILPLVPLLNEVNKRGTEVYFRAIPHSSIPTPEQLDDLDALEEITFVGYPSGIFDTVNLVPVFRRGTTATPLQLDYTGRPLFLVDASVFPGSSGSPVLIYNLGGWGGRKGFTAGMRFLFLGIMAEVAFREEEGSLEFRSIPTRVTPIVRTREMLDLGVVYKASTIVETVQAFLARNKKPIPEAGAA